MSVSIVPFTADHLDAAATLLAARHRHDRTRTPTFPQRTRILPPRGRLCTTC